MYPVSEAFLQAVQENTRKYYWTGKNTTKAGAEYPIRFYAWSVWTYVNTLDIKS